MASSLELTDYSPGSLESLNYCDDVIDLWCEPCYFESDRIIQAVAHCTNCNSILCERCENEHSKKNGEHEVLREQDLPKSNNVKPVKYLDCSLHTGNKCDYFCLTHAVQICSRCTKKDHKRCVVKSITYASAEISRVSNLELKTDIQDAQDKINEINVSMDENIQYIKEREATLLQELDDRHDQVISKLNQQHTDMTDKIKEMFINANIELQDKKKFLCEISDSFDQSLIDIERTVKCGNKENSFIRMQGIVQKVNAAIKVIEQRTIREDIHYTLLQGQDAVSVPEHSSLLGEIRESRVPKPPLDLSRVTYPRPQINIEQIKVKKIGSVNVETMDKEEVYNVVGMAEIFDGSILVAEKMNKVIKTFSSDHNFLSFIALPSWPNGVTTMRCNSVFVPTVGRYIQCLQVSESGTLKLEEPLSVEYEVLACAVYKDDFLVTTDTNPPALKMIERNGTEIWSLTADSDGNYVFDSPAFVVCKMMRDKPVAIVSDSGQETLVVVDAENGELIEIITVRNGKPAGMSVDRYGNLYVCYSGTNEIGVWSADMVKYRIILSRWDLQRDVRCVLYNKTKDQLCVSYSRSAKIDMFKVSC